MSPEQAEAKPLDVRSDVFSFGSVLYQMFSGTRAFAGNTMAQTLTAVLRDDPLPLRASPALDRIVRRCVAKPPADRFQLAIVFAHAPVGRPCVRVLAGPGWQE